MTTECDHSPTGRHILTTSGGRCQYCYGYEPDSASPRGAAHMTTDHAPDPQALVAAALEAVMDAVLEQAEVSLGKNLTRDTVPRIVAAARSAIPSDARAAYDAALAQARAEGRRERVTVKPLEWWKPSCENNWTHGAETIFGTYYVAIDGGRHNAWIELFHGQPRGIEQWDGENRSRLDEAKDDAQAHYEARILSALSDAPAPAVTVAEAAEMLPTCCACGRIVDPREVDEGGDSFGAQRKDGEWTCSSECWDEALANDEESAALRALAEGGAGRG